MSFGAEVTFPGSLISEPTLSYATNGSATCNFNLLMSRTWTDRNQERKETRVTFRVVTWGTLAENVAKSLLKGDRVVVRGRVEERTWTDEHRGVHTRIELTADDVGPTIGTSVVRVERNPRKEAAPAAATPGRVEDDEPF